MPLFLPLTSVPRRVAVVEALQGGVAEKPVQFAQRIGLHASLLALLQRLVTHVGKPVEGVLSAGEGHEADIAREGRGEGFLEEGWRWLHWDGSSWTAQPAATAGGAQ